MLAWLASFLWFQLKALLTVAWEEARGRRYLLRALATTIPVALAVYVFAACNARWGRFPPLARTLPSATVVLLSWRRAPNLNLLVMLAARAPFVECVLVSNNNPAVRIADHVTFRDRKIRLRDQPQETMAGSRFPFALSHPAQRFIFIDDDVFFTPRQLTLLYQAMVARPDVPHGFRGALVVEPDDPSPSEQTIVCDQEVQYLFGAYLCTRAIVERYISLSSSIGIVDHEKLRAGCDLILSMAGASAPIVHAIGPVVECATSYLVGVSLSASLQTFVAERRSIVERLWLQRPDLKPVRGMDRKLSLLEPPLAVRLR